MKQSQHIKRIFSAFFYILILLTLAGKGSAKAEEQTPGRPLLVTCYLNYAWGEVYQIGMIDENGIVWEAEGSVLENIPYSPDAYTAFAENRDFLHCAGSVSQKDLFDIKGLIATCENQAVTYTPAACDAGMQTALAYRTNQAGEVECIILGASGDSMYENTSPAAQALYTLLRNTFPGVCSFPGDGMGPQGFEERDLFTFLNIPSGEALPCTLTAAWLDCESGEEAIPATQTVASLQRLSVTGMKSAAIPTGNITLYRLYDEQGNFIAAISFYGDLLLTEHGLYYVK